MGEVLWLISHTMRQAEKKAPAHEGHDTIQVSDATPYFCKVARWRTCVVSVRPCYAVIGAMSDQLSSGAVSCADGRR